MNNEITTLTTLAEEINTAHAEAERHARRAIEHAMRAGELLMKAKEAVPHGGWLPWLSENCTVSERQAQRYMRLARHSRELQAKSDTVSDLTQRQAMALLADDPPPSTILGLMPWNSPLPAPGTMLVGWDKCTSLDGDFVVITESVKHQGYFYMTIILVADDGGGMTIQMRRPGRPEILRLGLSRYALDPDTLTWSTMPFDGRPFTAAESDEFEAAA